MRTYKRVKLLVLIVASVFLLTNFTGCSDNKKDANNPEQVSKTKIMGLSAVSAFSPGIAILSLAYHVKNEKNKNHENGWLVNLIWLFWIVAFIDVTLDKIPGAATVNQFVEHGLIWYLSYAATTSLGADVSMVLAGLTGSGVQAFRQTYHLGTDYGTLGVGTPVRSVIEDIIAGVSVYSIL